MNFSPHGVGNPVILEHLLTSMTPNMKCQKTPFRPYNNTMVTWYIQFESIIICFTHSSCFIEIRVFVAVFNPIMEPYFKYDYIFSWYLDIVLPYWDQWMLSDSVELFCVSVSFRNFFLLFITVLWPMTDASY